MSSDPKEKAIFKQDHTSEGTPLPYPPLRRPNVQDLAARLDTEKKVDADDSTETKPEVKGDEQTDAAGKPAAASDWFRQYFSVAMGLETPKQRLDEVSFEGIARYIQSDKCNKIVTLAGAGISTSAGIPDFRSPGTGVYDRLKGLDIPEPENVFQLDYFKEHPDIVYMLRKELMVGTYKPTPCHYFIKLLHDKQKLFRHFTQNIDGLELDAGLEPEVLVQAHGTCHTYHCMECKHTYTKQYMQDILSDDALKVPKCNQKNCDGVIRPDIVFFGESLPDTFRDRVDDIKECDLLIILGTSLVVQPFASLTSMTMAGVPRLYINLEQTCSENYHPLTALMFGGGFDFAKEDNIRDVFWQGKCDEGCYALADLLGWGDELRDIVKTAHANIDKQLGVAPGSQTKAATKATTKAATKPTTSSPRAQPKKTSGELSKSGDKASTDTSKSKVCSKTPSTSKPVSSSKTKSSSPPAPMSTAVSKPSTTGAKPKTQVGTKTTSRK